MNAFNIISGLASIISLAISIWALRAVYSMKVEIGLTDKSQTKITQRAEGRDIKQAGGDING